MTEAALRYQGFSFTYAGAAAPVVGPVDWEIPQGSLTLLVGATGSGKTTLLRSAKPQIAPEGLRTGVVEAPSAQLATSVGYVSQSPDNQLVCDTVWHQMAFGLENLGVSQADMRRRVAEVAHFFGMEPWFDKNVNELSGGQKQMVNLASVMVMAPSVLLLDEPTAQLDVIAGKSFCHALFRLNRELGLTIVVATHSPQMMLEYATDCVQLRSGRIEAVSIDNARSKAAQQQAALQAELQAADPAELGEQVLLLRDAYCRYSRAEGHVLRGMDLSVRRGSIHALVGGNGCGKSTLLRLAAGTLKADRGRVSNALKARQALLPQDPKALFACDTVAEEMHEWQAACGYSDEDVSRAAREYGISSCLSQHPYDLSGGQQQLLALAKLMLTKPDLLLLDEPTKGLDPAAKQKVGERLTAARAEGVTVLMACHDLAFIARMADQVTLLFDGQNACTQSAGEFFKRNLFYRPVPDGPIA